jgi:hypothetical protein
MKGKNTLRFKKLFEIFFNNFHTGKSFIFKFILYIFETEIRLHTDHITMLYKFRTVLKCFF